MTEKNDILKDLFSRMPEEELPASFRANAIRQIMAEAERIRKRNERWGWIAVIAASLLMVGIAIASFHIRTDPQYEHTPLLCLYRDACPHPAGSRLQIQATIQKEADVSERKDVSSGITSPKDCFFHAKSLASQKKALPLPRFLRDDNIKSNLLIKTNLVLTIKEWKI